MIKEKALEVPDNASFVASNQSLDNWKRRYSISFKTLHGEKKSADKPAAEKWLNEDFPSILITFGMKDIFNADEYALYFRDLPYKSYFSFDALIGGFKVRKDRISDLACANMDGGEKRLLSLGKVNI